MKVSKKIVKIIFLVAIAIVNTSCIETFDFESENKTFESALVIEATITNELKLQEVLLSRVFMLDIEGPAPESNAQVKIIDDTNSEYLFKESDSAGLYLSMLPFAAKQDHDYTLLITTNNGGSYKSSSKKFTQSTSIDSLYVVRDFNEDGQEGVSIYINSFDPTGNSQYYRFEYEEAYKIIAPLWVNKDLIFGTPPEPMFVLVQRPIEEKVCYNIVRSNNINITTTLDLLEDRLDKHRIRFLNRNNYIISHRYTIEATQYIQSREAYNYYDILNKLSGSESLFSESQTGFIQGNIFSLNNKNEKVVGFFEVSAVDIKRVYFNYKDLFPSEELPPYVISCDNLIKPPIDNPSPSGSLCPLCDFIIEGNSKYVSDNPAFDSNDPNEGPYVLVRRACGDCTVLGKSETPEFWIE